MDDERVCGAPAAQISSLPRGARGARAWVHRPRLRARAGGSIYSRGDQEGKAISVQMRSLKQDDGARSKANVKPSAKLPAAIRARWLLRCLSLLALAVLYLLLTQKYRAYDIDNPWFLSFSYNACHEHIGTDEFEQDRFPTGMDGVHLFGKMAAGV